MLTLQDGACCIPCHHIPVTLPLLKRDEYDTYITPPRVVIFVLLYRRRKASKEGVWEIWTGRSFPYGLKCRRLVNGMQRQLACSERRLKFAKFSALFIYQPNRSQYVGDIKNIVKGSSLLPQPANSSFISFSLNIQ